MIEYLEFSYQLLGANYHLDFRNNPLNPIPKDWILSSSTNKANQGDGGKKEEEKVFHLDAAFVNQQKKSVSKQIWEKEGRVDLPVVEGFTTMIIDVEETLAGEIKSLFLNENPVTKVEDVNKLTGVNFLDGTRCGFVSVPSWIEKLQAVEFVHLNENDITEIPPFFSRLKKLRYLNLSKNRRLRSIPRIGDSLTWLLISDCDIQTLSPDFFNHHLVEVELSGNRGEA